MAKNKYWLLYGSSGMGWATKIFEVKLLHQTYVGATKVEIVRPWSGAYFSLKFGAQKNVADDDLFDTKEEAARAAIISLLTSSEEKDMDLKEAHLLFIKNIFELKDAVPYKFERQYKEHMKVIHG